MSYSVIDGLVIQLYQYLQIENLAVVGPILFGPGTDLI